MDVFGFDGWLKGDSVGPLNKCIERMDGEVRRCFIGDLFEDILVVAEIV